ncbi:MAG: hypothetical protein EXR75_13235 [Myxococcales bacterium]|nr:hypothetical protein [Myxococcales bacterium]
MDRGYQKLGRGEHEGALADFRGADALMNVSSTGLAVALALEKLGRLIETREKLLDVGRLAGASGEASALREAREKADKLQFELADRIPSLEFHVSGLAAGVLAAITVDGAAVPPGTMSLPRKVNPGKRVVRATAAGFQPLSVEVSVAERETKKVPLAFILAAANDADGSDGSGGAPMISTFMWIGGGLATVGVLAGGVAGGLSLGAASDAKAGCINNLCPAANEAHRDSALNLAHISTGSFALASVGAGLFAYGLLFESPLLGDDGVRPMFGLGTAGIAGSF